MIIVLFPGAMKPFHDGHLFIIDSYANLKESEDISEIRIIISQKDRSGITAQSSYDFISHIDFNSLYDDVDVHVEIAENPSPIKDCYNIVLDDEDLEDQYCLASSSKDKKDSRIDYFYNYFEKKDQGNKTIRLLNKIKPVLYKNRTDKFNGKPVSASVARFDVFINDFENFKTSYTYMLKSGIISEEELEDYFDQLRSDLNFSKADEKKMKDLLERLNSKRFRSLNESFSSSIIYKTFKENIKRETPRYTKDKHANFLTDYNIEFRPLYLQRVLSYITDDMISGVYDSLKESKVNNKDYYIVFDRTGKTIVFDKEKIERLFKDKVIMMDRRFFGGNSRNLYKTHYHGENPYYSDFVNNMPRWNQEIKGKKDGTFDFKKNGYDKDYDPEKFKHDTYLAAKDKYKK